MSIGFPDYGRQVKQTGAHTITYSAVVHNTVNVPIAYCGDYGLIDITCDCTSLADYYLVTVFFYDDSAATQLVYSYNFITLPGQLNGLQIPAPAEYVQVRIQNNLNADINSFILRARSTSQRHPNPWQAYKSVPPFLVNASIANGVTRTDEITTLLTGPCVLNASGEGSGTWHLFIDRYVFSSNTWQTFFRYDTGGLTQAVVLPVNLVPTPLRVNMSNDGASAHQFLYSILPEMV